MDVDLLVLPIKGPDIVLGIQWLQKLGKVTHDYSTQRMEFTWLDHVYALKGDDALLMKRISLHHMHALLEFEDIYGVPYTLPPHWSIDHRIHLFPNTKPINVRPYRYPHYQKGEMEKLVNEMLSQGTIRVSHSPFSSPVLLVKKKDGSYRFWVNYWALNEVIVKDKFPIPTANEMFNELGGVVIFTKLDLRVGYHQICGYDQDVYNTAFRHIISNRGVEVDPKNVLVVSKWPIPMMQRHVRGFLGLAGYYQRFIKDYATLAAPYLIPSKNGFKWGGIEDATLSALKDRLTHAPILCLPDFEDTFVIKADASVVGIGVVLLQNGRPLGYFSRKLGPRMTVAATYQKELFAIVEVVYKWCQYLKTYGFDFDIEYKTGASNLVADALSRVFEEDDEASGGLLQPLPIPTAVWEDVSIDFIMGLPIFKGLTIILVMVDHFTKYAHFGTLPTSFNASKVAELFMDMVVKHHGFPKTIVSDRDPIFVVAIDELLVERNVLLRQLKENLFAARNRMEMQADCSLGEVEFNMGDKLLVKL
uniref:Retrovirus-related Pol polyprotein from transposon 297 family n=1 Tax=Tanacetum cinerariifolium TaxID=118510 RepID=A0A699H5E3_TANCI|nr:retrovirus-related Pol polyprotein from transposon 297 family [Tanacetum cinerariifolium]